MGSKERPSTEKEATLKHNGLKKKYLRWKKRQPQNARGTKERPLTEKRQP
jgi:hypothetical protein